MHRTAFTLTASSSAQEPLFSCPAGLSSTRSRVTAVLLGSLFVALCAQVAIPLPWTPVPMTMQPFGVLLIGLLLGPQLGAAAMAAYLLEASIGLPVLVPGFGGLFPLSASAGYLLSYPAVAAITGLLSRRGGFLRALGAAAVGDLIILISGAAWLALITHSSVSTAYKLGILPFLAGDCLKVILAAILAVGLLRFRAIAKPDAL